MKAANLYLLTRNRDKNFYTQYENILSGRTEILKVKEHEFENLIHLVERLCEKGVTVDELEGFYYAYTIRQIGKEFDLLKIYDNCVVLNIEMKSQSVPEEKIEKQLLKNRYYLSSIAPTLHLFTFVDETGLLYTLEGEKLRLCELDELVRVVQDFDIFETGDIDGLFRAKDYLISPLNMPEKFVENRYFLTQQQEMIKKEIMSEIVQEKKSFYRGITGTSGTGKTLLLYDLAKSCTAYGRCCIIHNGMLSDGHALLNVLLDNIDIIDGHSILNTGAEMLKLPTSKNRTQRIVDLEAYDFVFVDEAQRMSAEMLADIVESTGQFGIPCVFSYDYFQTLSKTEQRRNIPGKLMQLEGFQEYKLSGRIRSNEEMSSFIRTLLDLSDTAGKTYGYDAVDVAFAADMEEAANILRYYANVKNYTFIEYGRIAEQSEFLDICGGGFRTEDVIGQEFEQVVITLDDSFYYNEEGKLQGKNHPNPDYIYDRLFFQAVSRTREKLCIVVIGNVELFECIVSIKYRNIGVV